MEAVMTKSLPFKVCPRALTPCYNKVEFRCPSFEFPAQGGDDWRKVTNTRTDLGLLHFDA